MSHDFELHKDVSLDASPEQVWDAIATGPGVDSWFMGRSEIEPGEGGIASLTVADRTDRATVAAWEPGRRLSLRVGGQEGPAMAIEYLIEARDGASTVLRLVQSAVLGDDWETEFEAMKTGWGMYLHTLAEYLRHFPGRHGLPVTVMRPDAGERATCWPVLTRSLGLPTGYSVGTRASFNIANLGETSGVVDYVDDAGILGVRSEDGLYRFMHTGPERGNVLFLSHHLFADVDGEQAERGWQAWLDVLLDNTPANPAGEAAR